MRDQAVQAYNRGVTQITWPEKRQAGIASFTEAIKLDPQFAHGYFGRAVCLAWSARHEEAIQDYDRAIALNPNEPVFYRGRAFSYMALRYGSIGDRCDLQAQADIAKADKLEGKKNPLWADTSSTVGGNADAMLLDFLPQPVTASATKAKTPKAEKPERGDRARAEALYNQAMDCMESGGLKKEALRLLKEAIAADPTYPDPHDGLADVYTSMGDAAAATAAMRKCGELKAKERAKNKQWWQFWK